MAALEGGIFIELTLSEQDVIDFNQFTWTRSHFHRRDLIRQRALGFVYPLLGVAAVVGYEIINDPKRTLDTRFLAIMAPAALVVSLVWGGLCWIWFSKKIGAYAKRLARDESYARYLLPSKLTLSHTGVTSTGAAGLQMTPWNSISDIAVTATAAYAYISANMAYIIPRRAFPNEAAFDRFIDELRRYRSQFGA